jgi:hypothetical protein
MSSLGRCATTYAEARLRGSLLPAWKLRKSKENVKERTVSAPFQLLAVTGTSPPAATAIGCNWEGGKICTMTLAANAQAEDQAEDQASATFG